MSQLVARGLEGATDTKEIAFGRGAVVRTGELFASLYDDRRAVVVADENTYAAIGAEVDDSLAAAGVETALPYIFPGRPTLYAGYENVELLREYLRPLSDCVVCSIGSGTLNDLAKLASGELGRPYINVCTAASVDGYAAYGASIAKDGFKNTRACPAPSGLVVDLDVAAAAPKRLTATGYGDLIEKIPAGADWIVADELEIEPIDPAVWDLVQGDLHAVLDAPDEIGAGDPVSIGLLSEANILSGLAMQAMRSSRPASGAGHQFSHVWEMEGHGLEWDPPLSHGFKVGVGTVASCALWEEALKVDIAALDPATVAQNARTDAEVERRARELLIPRIADEAVGFVISKNLTGEDARRRVEKIQRSWGRIRARASRQLISPEDAADRLDRAGAPSHPEQIGIDWKRFRLTHLKAQMIRPRYTVLDLLTDIGKLDEAIDHLFSDEGYWGRHRHPE